MKKLSILLTLSAFIFFALSACATQNQATQADVQQEAAEEAGVATVPEAHGEQPSSVMQPIPEGFRVVIIGSGSPQYNIHRGGSSVLIQYQDKLFLVDCGPDSSYNLAKSGVPIGLVSNIFFTHQHNDHNADFWTFFIGGWGSQPGRTKLNLAGPGVQSLYDVTTGYYKEDLDYRINDVGNSPDGIYNNVEIYDFTDPVEELTVDGVRIKAMPVPHTIDTYAYRFEAGGQSVVISGDMKYLEEFGSFAAGADILVMDAMLTSTFSDAPPPVRKMIKENLKKSHITQEEIGMLASAAQPKKMVMSHLGPIDSTDAVRAEYVQAGYAGEILFAFDGMVVEP